MNDDLISWYPVNFTKFRVLSDLKENENNNAGETLMNVFIDA